MQFSSNSSNFNKVFAISGAVGGHNMGTFDSHPIHMQCIQLVRRRQFLSTKYVIGYQVLFIWKQLSGIQYTKYMGKRFLSKLRAIDCLSLRYRLLRDVMLLYVITGFRKRKRFNSGRVIPSWGLTQSLFWCSSSHTGQLQDFKLAVMVYKICF